MNIDLHGYNEEQAIGILLTALIEFDMSEYETMQITTGRGTGALKQVVGDLLDAEDYPADYDDSSSSYTVYKKEGF